MGKTLWLRNAVCLILGFLLFTTIGCSPKVKAPPTPQTQSQSQSHTLPNTNLTITQMNKAVDEVEAKSKANQLSQAKGPADDLFYLNDQLSTHLSDANFRDNLRKTVAALKEELEKATPNQAIINSQIQSLRNMLKDAPGKVIMYQGKRSIFSGQA